LNGAGSNTYNGNITIAAGATFQYSSSTAQTTNGAITGGGGLTVDGGSDFTIRNGGQGTTGYSGPTLITGTKSRLIIGNVVGANSPFTTITVSGGGQYFGFNGSTVPNNFTISGAGYAEGSDSQNNFSGTIRLEGASSTLSGIITLAGDSRIARFGSGTTTISGRITGPFGIDLYGFQNGINAAEVFVLSNTANNYTGNTTIFNSNFNTTNLAGVSTTLRLGASNVIPNGASGGNVVFAINGTNNNATTIFDLNGFSETINGVTVNAGTFATRITNTATGASTLTIGDNDTTSSFSGTITDGGVGKTLAITKVGTGTLTLSSTNNYLGATTVSAGTLVATGSLSGTTQVTVSNGATLVLNAAGSTNALNASALVTVGGGTSGTLSLQGVSGSTGTSAGALSLASNSVINFGTGDSNTLTFASLASLGSGITIENWTGSLYGIGAGQTDSGVVTQDRLVFSSGAGFGLTDGLSLPQFSFLDDTGAFLGFGQAISYAGGFEIVPIPEPTTAALIGSVALCALFSRRRRNSGLKAE
jgi:autotransporter-associated beta strand protein